MIKVENHGGEVTLQSRGTVLDLAQELCRLESLLREILKLNKWRI